MELAELLVPAVVFVFGYAIMALGYWMMRRPERLEAVVWPDPKPIEKRDLDATKRVGLWLIFLGPFLSFMIVGIAILAAILPSAIRNNLIAFPLIAAAAAFAAYKLRQSLLSRQKQSNSE